MPSWATKAEFMAAAEARTTHSHDVKIDPKALAIFANHLKENISGAPMRWDNYISDTANAEPVDPARILFEFALSSAQNGGYLYAGADGSTQKWEENGSGAAALVNKIKEIRDAKAIPGIDITAAEVDARIGPMLAGIPYRHERLEIFKEFAAPGAMDACGAIMARAKQPDGSYHFTYDTMQALAERFPKGLGEDPYLKKAALTLLLLSSHLEARGVRVTTDLPAAAEYRLFQTLEAAGVIQASDHLVKQINANVLFEENDPAVHEMRAAIVSAVHTLSQLTQLPDRVLDATLWFVGRKPEALHKLREAVETHYEGKLGGGLLGTHFATTGMRFKAATSAVERLKFNGWDKEKDLPGQNRGF